MGILNPQVTPITIKFIKIYVNNVLSKTYSVSDPDLANNPGLSNIYIYDLGPFVLSSGIIDMSTVMAGWSVRFDYECKGVAYQNTVAVKRNTFGQVNYNDFYSNTTNSAVKKPLKLMMRNSSSLKSIR